MTGFSLHLTLHEHGWTQASITAEGDPLNVSVSYLSDALSDLAESVLTLFRSPRRDQVTCCWQDEPEEHRWILHRVGEEVRVEIVRFDHSFSRLPDEQGQCVFETHCTLMRLATQVTGQLHQMLNEYGADGYHARWRHPFPMSTFRQLQAQIQDRKHPAT